MEEKLTRISYEGNFRTAIRYQNQVICTDAVKEYGGLGESLTPAELLPAAVASCTMTTIAMKAAKMGLSVDGFYIEISKEFSDHFSLASMTFTCHMPAAFPEEHRASFELAGEKYCIVGRSVDPAIEQKFIYLYDVK